MRPEGSALRDRLVGIIAVVRPLADLVAIGRQRSTRRTFSEVVRYLQLCRTSLRLLTCHEWAAINRRERRLPVESERSGGSNVVG